MCSSTPLHMACTAAVETLPPELMDQIFGYLVRPPPSASRLHDQPKPTMLRARGDDDPPCDLKSLSLVNKRWRAMTLPTLFRHVHWALDRWDLLLAEPKADLDQDQDQDDAAASSLPLLPFLSDNGLGRHVDTLTMVVGDSLEHLSRVPQGHPGRAHLAEQAKTYNEDNNWVWRLLFSVMDPTRITVIASPQMLASLLSRMLFLGDAWSFTPLCHILSLSREDRQSAPSDTPDTASAGPSRARPSQLFTVRPWTSLLLNEGSSVRVYSTYDFIFKRPPSILGALLGAEQSPNDRPLVPTTIRNLAYVGIFPLSSHFHVLVNHLPRLDRLFVQLVPRDRDPPAPEGPEMRNVLTSDLCRSLSHLLPRRLLHRAACTDDDGVRQGCSATTATAWSCASSRPRTTPTPTTSTSTPLPPTGGILMTTGSASAPRVPPLPRAASPRTIGATCACLRAAMRPTGSRGRWPCSTCARAARGGASPGTACS